MPVNITDVDTFTDPVSAPDDGDPADGVVFQDPIQDLANRTRYLKNRSDALYGNAPVALEGVLELNDEDVAIEQDLTVGGNLTVAIQSTFTSGFISHFGSVINAVLTVDEVNCTGEVKGRFRFGSTGVGADADSTLTVGSSPQVIVATTLTANREYTISDTGAEDGDFFWIMNDDAAQDLTITGPSGGLGVLSNHQGGLFVRVGGTWHQLTTTT